MTELEPVDLRKIECIDGEWCVQRTFLKGGKRRLVKAYGDSRYRALENFETEKHYLELEVDSRKAFVEIIKIIWEFIKSCLR